MYGFRSSYQTIEYAMKLIIQPNHWTCLPTSVAMLLDKKLETVLDYIGHDGSEIAWPSKPEPQCRRAFHIQEIVDYVHSIKRFLMLIEVQPFFVHSPEIAFENLGRALKEPLADRILFQKYYDDMAASMYPIDRRHKLNNYLAAYDGILIGLGSRGHPHAATWNHLEGCIYDPCGERLLITSFTISTFWLLVP